MTTNDTEGMETLGKLFSSDAIVKVMRLFLMNPEMVFETRTVSERARISPLSARTEVGILQTIGFVTKNNVIVTQTTELKSGAQKIVKRKIQGWKLDENFAYAEPLKNLLIDSELINSKKIAQKIAGSGRVKLIVLSGLFMKDKDRVLDMIIVGENLSRPKLHTALTTIEAEVGKELRYAIFDVQEFKYRLDMYDKLVRDVFDNKHEIVIDDLKGKYRS